MTDRLTAEARAEVDRYLDEVRAVLRDTSLDLDEIEADLRDHLREAAAASGHPEMSRAEVEEVLDRLGPPSRWLAGMEPVEDATGRGATPKPRGGVEADLRLPWLVFVLTILGLGLFPWVGPFVLVPAWLLARAVAGPTRAPGDVFHGGGRASDSTRLWLVRPILILGSVTLIALLLFWPVGPLLELGGRFGDGVRRLPPLLGALGLWWTLVGIAARRWTRGLAWLLHPIRPTRAHATRLSWIGAVSALAGLVIYLITR